MLRFGDWVDLPCGSVGELLGVDAGELYIHRVPGSAWSRREPYAWVARGALEPLRRNLINDDETCGPERANVVSGPYSRAWLCETVRLAGFSRAENALATLDRGPDHDARCERFRIWKLERLAALRTESRRYNFLKTGFSENRWDIKPTRRTSQERMAVVGTRFLQKREALRYAGEVIRDAMSAARAGKTVLWSDVVGELNTLRRKGHGYTTDQRVLDVLNALDRALAVGLGVPSAVARGAVGDNIGTCSECGDFSMPYDLTHSEEEDACFCDHCRDAVLVHSESMDDSIRREESRALCVTGREVHYDSPSDVCTPSWAIAHRCRGFGEGYVTQEAWSDYLAEYCSTDDDDDDDSPEEELAGYHSSSRPFPEHVTSGSPYPALGVELEVYAEDRSAAVRAVKSGTGHICERDGSLNDWYGFEIITDPYGKPEWTLQAKKLLSILAEESVVGYSDPAGTGYGIHITVHRRHLSPLQEARMMMFLCAEENHNFVRAIAQRENIYAAGLDMGGLGSCDQDIQHLGGLFLCAMKNGKASRKIEGLGKYAPINWKSTLAEIRIFQSTTHLPSFMKNLEFVWAMVEWTSPHSCTGSTWRHDQFVSWLAHRARVKQDYPYLVEYLQRDGYIVKGSHGVQIVNTWLPLLLGKRDKVLACINSELVEHEEPLRTITPVAHKQKRRAA